MPIPIKGIIIFIVIAIVLAWCFKDEIYRSFKNFKNDSEDQNEKENKK